MRRIQARVASARAAPRRRSRSGITPAPVARQSALLLSRSNARGGAGGRA